MKFKMPAVEELAKLSMAELEELRTAARAEFDELTAGLDEDGANVSQERLDAMNALDQADATLTARIDTVRAEETDRVNAARALVESRTARTTEPEPPADPIDPGDGGDGGGEPDGGAAVVAEAEQVAAEAAAEAPAVTASTAAPSFRGLGAATGRRPANVAPPSDQVGFVMRPTAHKYVGGHVGFRELAASIEAMAPGHRIFGNRDPLRIDGGANKIPLSLATLDRGFGPSHIIDGKLSDEERTARIDEIVNATEYRAATFDDNGALVASGGHCAVPETIYTFCDVTPATGLATWPAMNLGPRGGQRRPMEPDFSELYNTLPWRFTEAELQAENPDGTPVVTKPCVEIPCVEWEEVYVDAIGLCVTSGILQRRGFPESIERFLAEVVKAHLIKVHLWSLMDVEADSTPYTIPSAGGLGAAGAFLNGVALRAVVQRQEERLGKDAPIEGKTPAYMLEVAKADMALQQGRDVKNIPDSEIDSWLASRNIFMEWVQHWQPIPKASTRWPSQVRTLLFPRGTWYQHLENVIEVGTLHSKDMLQKNRQMELFTEDEYLMDRRCKTSEVLTINVCANGSVGAREQVTCPTTTNEVQTGTISGSPTGGTFTLSFGGDTTTALPYNATAAQVQAALALLPSIGTGNVAVSGPAGGPYTVTFQGVLGATNVALITATGAFTGGSSPSIAVVQTTAGAPN
ncbi:major capsid protein [Nocardia abscessus]|uniref:major capsid protein n=1 Tax=Nocardia abscessus TaxID=120957 RepID=UPI0024589674|nr:major capsid protein [Nocardia abscessus]